MQVFVPYQSPIDVARCLDKRRLHKQVVECDQILKAITGQSAGWRNHPIVKMYFKHTAWLWYYRETLDAYNKGCMRLAKQYSRQCDTYFRPEFLTQRFCNQHRRRLYTKSPSDYPQFSRYGESEENWYFVDGKVIRYSQGKKL